MKTALLRRIEVLEERGLRHSDGGIGFPANS
jgi:hypothetical protein